MLPTDNPAEGEVIEFNSTIFSGMLRDWGYTPKCIPSLLTSLKKSAERLKLPLTNAMASSSMLVRQPKRRFHRRGYPQRGRGCPAWDWIKPGKPAVLGMVKAPHKDGVIPVIGLPGYPVSGIIVMELVFKPVLNALTKQRTETPAIVEAVLSAA